MLLKRVLQKIREALVSCLSPVTPKLQVSGGGGDRSQQPVTPKGSPSQRFSISHSAKFV
jgi:hypothetical protein